MNATTFGAWLLEQTGRDDTTGRLARLAQGDGMFPQHGDRAIYSGYFEADGMPDDLGDAFDRAWDEFDGLPS